MKHRELITGISRSETLRRVALFSCLVAAYAVIPVTIEKQDKYAAFNDMPADIHAALTLVLGWLLVFRTNTSYARWWEARTLWGSLINASRTLASKLTSLVPVPKADLQNSHRLIIGFAFALKDHLRGGAKLTDIEGFEQSSQQPVHVPMWLADQLYKQLRTWRVQGVIDGDELRALDEELRRLPDICGACERIRNTRLAKSYRMFARQCVFLYLFSLPWGIVDSCHWWTVPLTAIISYFMIGLETVAEHVEEPFGYDEDDLDLGTLCDVIKQSVNEITGFRIGESDDDIDPLAIDMK